MRKFFEALILPFVSIAVMIDESKRINENGDWDAYNARKNRKLMKRGKR